MLTQRAAVASRQDLFVLTNSHMLLEEDGRFIVSEDSGSVEGLLFVTPVRSTPENKVCGGAGGGGQEREMVVVARSDGIFNSRE